MLNGIPNSSSNLCCVLGLMSVVQTLNHVRQNNTRHNKAGRYSAPLDSIKKGETR